MQDPYETRLNNRNDCADDENHSGKGFGIFDNKWVYITSIVIFCIGSAVCGAAPNMNALIIGRVIGGIGGAGMYLGSVQPLLAVSHYRIILTSPALSIFSDVSPPSVNVQATTAFLLSSGVLVRQDLYPTMR